MSPAPAPAHEIIREEVDAGLCDIADAISRLSDLTEALREASGGIDIIPGVRTGLSGMRGQVESFRRKLASAKIEQPAPGVPPGDILEPVKADEYGLEPVSPSMTTLIFASPNEDGIEPQFRAEPKSSKGAVAIGSPKGNGLVPPGDSPSANVTAKGPFARYNHANILFSSRENESGSTFTLANLSPAIPPHPGSRSTESRTSTAGARLISATLTDPFLFTTAAQLSYPIKPPAEKGGVRMMIDFGSDGDGDECFWSSGMVESEERSRVSGVTAGPTARSKAISPIEADILSTSGGGCSAVLTPVPFRVVAMPSTSSSATTSSTTPRPGLRDTWHSIPLELRQSSGTGASSSTTRTESAGISTSTSDPSDTVLDTAEAISSGGDHATLVRTAELAKIQLPPSPTASEEVRKVWGDVGLMGMFDGLDEMGAGRLDDLVTKVKQGNPGTRNHVGFDDMEVFLGLHMTGATISPSAPPVVSKIASIDNQIWKKISQTQTLATGSADKRISPTIVHAAPARISENKQYSPVSLNAAIGKGRSIAAETSSIREHALLEADNVEISAAEAEAVKNEADFEAGKPEKLAVVIIDAHDVMLMPDRVSEGFGGSTRFLQDLTRVCRDLLSPDAQGARLSVKLFLDSAHVCQRMYVDDAQANAFFSGLATESDVERVEIKGHGERHNQVLGEIAKQIQNEDCVSVYVAAHCSEDEILEMKLSLAHPSKLIGLVKSKAWEDHLDAIGFAQPRIGRLLKMLDDAGNERLTTTRENSVLPSAPIAKSQVVPGIEDWATYELNKGNEWALDEYLKGQRPPAPIEEAPPLHNQLIVPAPVEPLPLQLVTMSQLAPRARKKTPRVLSDRGPVSRVPSAASAKPNVLGAQSSSSLGPNPNNHPLSRHDPSRSSCGVSVAQASIGLRELVGALSERPGRTTMRISPSPEVPPSHGRLGPQGAWDERDRRLPNPNQRLGSGPTSPPRHPASGRTRALLPQWLALLETLWYFDRMRGLAYGAHERHLIADQMKPKFGGYFGSGYYGYPTFDSLIQTAVIDGWVKIGRSVGEYTVQATSGAYELAGL